jgi:hypothetical protein
LIYAVLRTGRRSEIKSTGFSLIFNIKHFFIVIFMALREFKSTIVSAIANLFSIIESNYRVVSQSYPPHSINRRIIPTE